MEQIANRIRKLLALAGNNPSAAEREAALKKAHQLLIDHNLEMHDVADKVEEVSAFNANFPFRPSPWIRMIANSVAELYFCKFVFTRYGKASEFKATFIGMRVDADIARVVVESLLRTVKHQGAAHARATGGSEASFKSAAAAEIYWRCKAMMKDAQSEKTPGTALVVQSLYKTRAAEAQAWIDKNMKLGNRPGGKLRLRADESAQAGYALGKSLPLTAKIRN